MSPSILVSAFRKSGIYPLNRNQVSGEVLAPSAEPSNKEHAAEPGSTTTEPTAAVQAFDALEGALSTPAKTTCRRRMKENYDLDGSPTLMAWKKLFNYCFRSSSQQAKSVDSPNKATGPDFRGDTVSQTTEPTSNQLNTSAGVLREIQMYFTVEPTGPPKRRNLKRTIPNFVNGPESMQLLLDKKLKKARQLAEKQKKMREMEAAKKEENEREWRKTKLGREIRKKTKGK